MWQAKRSFQNQQKKYFLITFSCSQQSLEFEYGCRSQLKKSRAMPGELVQRVAGAFCSSWSSSSLVRDPEALNMTGHSTIVVLTTRIYQMLGFLGKVRTWLLLLKVKIKYSNWAWIQCRLTRSHSILLLPIIHPEQLENQSKIANNFFISSSRGIRTNRDNQAAGKVKLFKQSCS